MPDKLPRGWIRTKLGAVCLPVDMVQPSVTPNAEFTYFDIGCINNELNLIADPKTIIGREAPSRARQRAQIGDILFSTVRTYLRKIARIERQYLNPVASTGFTVIRPAEGVSSRFLFFQVLYEEFLQPLHALQTGSSYPAVRDNDVFSQLIQLPPTAEQERIVAKIETLLSRLTAGQAAVHRALKRLNRYRASVLHAAVTGELTRDWRKSQEPDETGEQLLKRLLQERRTCWTTVELERLQTANKSLENDDWKKSYPAPTSLNKSKLAQVPYGWSWGTLDQITKEGRPIVYGIIKPGPHDPKGIPYVRVTEMKDGAIDVTTLKKASPERAAKFARATLASGDILISKDGTIGKVAVVPPELAGGNITQHVVRASIHEMMCRDFVVLSLRSDWCQRWLTGETRGVALQGVNVGDFRKLPIPIPPLEEQKRIAQAVEHRLAAADRLTITLTRQLDRVSVTRQSLLKQAFSGKLVSQAPMDESASALLDRIHAARQIEVAKPKSNRMLKFKVKPVRLTLLEVLQQFKKPMTPEQLFREAGFEPNEVDLFYRELTSLRKLLLEKKPTGAAAKAWPFRAQVLLELKPD